LDVFGARSLPFFTRRNYVHEMLHISPWSLLAGVLEGQFGAIVITKTFHGGSFLTAVAVAAPLAALTFSLHWGLLCQGRPKMRLYTNLCLATVLLTGLLGIVPVSDFGAVWFLAQMAAAQILLAGVVTVRSAMWKANYPQLSRGRITARLQAVREFGMVSSSMAAAWLSDIDSSAYAYVYPVAALLGFAGVHFLGRIHIRGEASELRASRARREAGVSPANARAVQLLSPMFILRSGVRVLRDDRRYATYVAAQLFVGLSNQLTMAVIIMLISKDVTAYTGLEGGNAYWFTTALIVGLPKLFLLGTIGRWGRLFDRLGVIRFRVINVACWLGSVVFELAAVLVLLGVDGIGPSASVWLTLILVVRGAFNGLGMAGGRLAWNIGHLHFAQGEEAEVYMGIHVSLTGLRGVVAPVLGMFLWQVMGWHLWSLAIGLSVASLATFQRMARQEASGPPIPPR
jgi:hypothetical protein